MPKNFLGKLRNLFREKKERNVLLEDVIDFFKEEKKDQLEAEKAKAEELKKQLKEKFFVLEKKVEKLENFKSVSEKPRIDDTVENFYRTRLKLFEKTDLPEDFFELEKELEDFINDFEKVKKKEQIILKRAGEEVDQVFKELRELKKISNMFSNLIENNFKSVKTIRSLKRISKEIEELKAKASNLKERKKKIDISTLEKEINEVRKDIREHEKDDRWEKLKELKKEKEELEDRKKNLKKDLSSAASNMERGIKKLVYEVENNDLELGKDVMTMVENIRDRNFGSIQGSSEKMGKVIDAVEKRNILGKRNFENFREAAKTFENIEEYNEKIDEFDKNIGSINEQIEEFSLERENKVLKNRFKSLERDLEAEKNKLRNIDDELKRNEKEIDKKIEKMESNLNKCFFDEILVKNN